MKKLKNKTQKLTGQYRLLLREGFFRGIGWALGVTVGFAFVSVVLLAFLSRLVTFPVVGSFVAEIVEATQTSLENR